MNEKKYYVRNGQPVEITDELLLNFIAEAEHESNRGLLLLSVAILDELLNELLTAFLGKGPSKKLANSSFKRIELAGSLNLIASRDCDAMQAMRTFRNECAHEVFRDNRKDQILTDLVNKVKTAADYHALNIEDTRSFIDQLIFELILGIRETTRRVETGEIQKLSEPDSFLQDL
jgi:hypothetical protein